ncbi:MAG: TetR/AcrR family transcriptional regulator C-terminal domain-containing protein [Eubacterium sp.]|nr:TetR/AcrR family transcriptional regulator C-terminal domain-containing protein [Eubacterium sp.]
MGISENTKKIFAEALQEMVKTKEVSKIRVKDLCERCGADRKTFYYHFHDKNELVAWIFAKDYEEAMRPYEDEYPEKHAADTLKAMYQKKGFYRKVFEDRSQNDISQYIFEYFVELGRSNAKRRLGEESIDTLTDYAIKSHAYACIGHTVQWLNGVTGYTPEEFAHLQYQTMPEVLRKAYGIDTNEQ